MNYASPEHLRDRSMLELFRAESDSQTAILTTGLLQLERTPNAPGQLEALMRAAHSLKGAARLVDLAPAVWIAHAMEDCFVAAQRGELPLARAEIDVLFQGVDLLQKIGRYSEGDLSGWAEAHGNEIEQFLNSLARLLGKAAADAATRSAALPPLTISTAPNPIQGHPASTHQQDGGTTLPQETGALATQRPGTSERVLRLTAENLNRLMGLAGESLVESRWLQPFVQNMQRLKRLHAETKASFDRLHATLREHDLPEPAAVHLQELATQLNEGSISLSERLDDLEQFDRRSAQLSHRLYLEVLRTRMRPFSDGVRQFPRMLRDLARTLGKEVHLEITGEQIQVDRDILEKLEGPLAHLLRNAVDHGCEMPAVRRQLGKPVPAVIRLEAHPRAGKLLVTVADDGAGVDLDALRTMAVHRRLTTPANAEKLTDAELLEFLFLPGFTLTENVTEISGRGVGLDIVQNMVKEVRGIVTISTRRGHGTSFQLQLPLMLSVIKVLLVQISGEPYAIPLGRIDHTLHLSRDRVETLEGRPHFRFQDQSIGLLAASQILECEVTNTASSELPVLILGDHSGRHGLVVDQFVGERELVVQPLDPRLGKVKDISAAALLEDGTPVLIVDVDDLLRSVEQLIADGAVLRLAPQAELPPSKRRKRVLAVDDSLTVRELERRLLFRAGYDVEVAVDGLDGWNTVRSGHYDLVIADVDMPRMDGIELTRLIKQDSQFGSMPVLLVSYKDQEEDLQRGLQAGADSYLTKSNFDDESLLQAVAKLIGDPPA